MDIKQGSNSAGSDQPEKVTGTINGADYSNEYILNNTGAYLEYIRAKIKEIIVNDGLKYSDPMEKKKIYPDFTYTQFLYLLLRLYDNVYSVNLELLHDTPYYYINSPYNVSKVKKAYEVYYRLCQYYGYNCTMEPFYNLTGISEKTFKEWLTSGRSDLYNIMYENAKKGVISRFENSKNPLLSLASANHKYNLDKPIQENMQGAVLDVLPDLLALTDQRKELTDGGK